MVYVHRKIKDAVTGYSDETNLLLLPVLKAVQSMSHG
jgi:hypothetical protein